MILDLTSKCNLSCRHCTRSKKENFTHADFQRIKILIEELNSIEEVKVIALQGGEPFLYEELHNLLDLIKNVKAKISGKEFKIELKKIIRQNKSGEELVKNLKNFESRKRFIITTNGTIYSDELVEHLISSGVCLEISIDSASKETYERRRIGANFEKVIENLERFSRYFPIELICAVYYDNLLELESLLHLAVKYGCEAIRFTPVRFPTRSFYEDQSFYDIYIKKIKELIAKMGTENLPIILKVLIPSYLMKKEEFLEVPNVFYKIGCEAFMDIDSVYIDPHMNVYACCHSLSYGPVGNLRGMSLLEVWKRRKQMFSCDITKIVKW
jgi:MoaA/NifB/PqqE/SkfB family radical SAM enzyme